MRDGSLGLVVGGGLVAGALLWRRSRKTAATPSSSTFAGWVVPVPTLADRPVVVSNEFRATDPHQHLGVDLMFRRRDARDLIAVFPPKTTNGTPLFFMPDGISALAAGAGTVAFADQTPMGYSVIIRHPIAWATYYTPALRNFSAA